MKEGVLVVLTLCVGIGFGAYVGANYLGKGDAVLAQCVFADQAIKSGSLNQEQVLALNFDTGQEISTRYPKFADAYIIDKEYSQKASANSLCSKVLSALSDGIQSTKPE